MMNQIASHSRKVKKGIVVSNKMEKTVVVNVERTLRHPIYGKIIKRSKKFMAHNENQDIKVGDEVDIVETRPLSKRKRWRVVAQQS